MALFNICSLTQTHICIEGKSGIGKTSCAKAFAEILKQQKFINNKIFSFHNNTTANDIFGSLTLDENKNISYCNGLLTDSIISGNIFIADELNLTSEETMNSLSSVLEEQFNYKIYIPGLRSRKQINPNFLMICCQNLSNSLGRKQYTKLLNKRIKIISYPEQDYKLLEINNQYNFESICVNINNSLKGQFNCINDETAKKFGRFILDFNK